MAIKHPLDPPVQWAAAATCGKLVAQGILSVEDIVPKLLEAAIRAGYRGDRSGLQTRLSWHVRDNADHWSRERDRVEFLIRRGIAPLLAEWAEPIQILRAAHAINEKHQEPLLRREVKDLVAAEMAARLRARVGRRRRVG
ncbi:MAG: hypothetical protein IRZ07_03855 [Microbispora sp.]|nr:hypothetical protein [Microbispora sp.]